MGSRYYESQPKCQAKVVPCELVKWDESLGGKVNEKYMGEKLVGVDSVDGMLALVPPSRVILWVI